MLVRASCNDPLYILVSVALGLRGRRFIQLLVEAPGSRPHILSTLQRVK